MPPMVRNVSTTKKHTMGTTAIVADPEVSAWKLITKPTATEKTPMSTAVAIIAGTRRTSRAAVAGGPTNIPKTNRVPTA